MNCLRRQNNISIFRDNQALPYFGQINELNLSQRIQLYRHLRIATLYCELNYKGTYGDYWTRVADYLWSNFISIDGGKRNGLPIAPNKGD
jgi:hypothetical protein